MRQDFIVKSKPTGTGNLRLWLKAEMQGGTVNATPEQISFLTPSGAEAMRYRDLKVWDASQKRLKARFEKKGNEIAIVVNDRNAIYPVTIDPLSTTENWTAESNQADAWFGNSVASAGDVNGDGFSDVIVGAYQFGNGQTGEGRAFVYYGGPGTLSANAIWTAESDQIDAQFGNSVASAGDVNGDGFSDVIIGSGNFDNGEVDEGRAFVYHGSASGLSATANWTAESNQANALFGFFVGSAGDVNGDGFSDVIIGANQFDNPESNEGRAFVYHGSASGLSATANWTAESNQADAQFGYSVASAGDVNGDGYSDVIVGAYFFDNGQTNEGRAFVYYGNETGGFRQDVRQFRPLSSTPIVPALKSVSTSQVQIRKREKSIVGRSNTLIEVEVKPLGTPFDGTGFYESSYNLHATTGTLTDIIAFGLSDRTMYKWRVRQAEISSSIGYILLPRSRWYYPAGVAPTESHFQVSNDDAPLPVELLFFRAASMPSGVRLTWQTASEIENAGFIIKREGVEIASFHTDERLRGQGTTLAQTDYSFIDATVEAGKTYTYALYDVSFSGIITAHEPVTLTYKGALRYALEQNFPNPFNPTTSIRYELPSAGLVTLKVYDVLGRQASTLVNARQEAGDYAVSFNGANLASGVYFYRLTAGSFVQTKKMLFVK